jgi:replication factor A1
MSQCLDTTNVPKINYNFVTLDTLQDVAKDATCGELLLNSSLLALTSELSTDVIGIVTQVGPLGEITSKQSKQFSKRELTIADKSGFSVRLTLWGKQAEQFNAEDSPVIAVKGVKVGDFGGESFSRPLC